MVVRLARLRDELSSRNRAAFGILRGVSSIFTQGRFSPALRWLALAGPIFLGVAQGGCASQLADVPLMGVPANAPARPTTPGEYLPVHDIPPPRDEAVLDPAAREKLEKELLAARDRQAAGAQAAQRRSN